MTSTTPMTPMRQEVDLSDPAAMPAMPATPPAAALDLAAMRQHAGEAVAMLKLLGNADRLMLLCQLAQQARTVGELEQLAGVHQPTLSQQLGILRREGLVVTRREGKFIWYQLADARALALMQSIHQLFCAPGANV